MVPLTFFSSLLLLSPRSYYFFVTMETITLKNGVVVEVDDKSRVLTGTLYLIHLEISMVVDLSEEDQELRRYCGGNRLRKTRVLKRQAVHAAEVDEVAQRIKESFLSTNLKYMNHPKFVERFKSFSLREFKEQEEEDRRLRELQEHDRDP